MPLNPGQQQQQQVTAAAAVRVLGRGSSRVLAAPLHRQTRLLVTQMTLTEVDQAWEGG
jgi:hypothetical protein